MRKCLGFLAALLLAGCSGGGGGGSSNTGGSAPSPPASGTTFTDAQVYSSAASDGLASPNEITGVTKHQLVMGSTTLNYTATAGHLSALSLTNPAPEASFFYIAYTLDGANPATRPVTFFYNGGPGSPTVWLHLGSFGPKRLVTNAPSTTTPTPFAFVDNTESLLDVSDLVFVDAIGTGFSEAISPNTNRTFWGTDVDAAAFRDFVMRYLTANNRNASPKFLFGESYGTPRSAILVSLLENAGVQMTGVVLQSSVLNYNSNCGVFSVVTISCSAYLPSYAAVGAWLNLVTPPQPIAQLPAYMAQMRTVASTQYDPAVRAYLLGGASPNGPLVAQLAAQTGMSAGNWASHFNMDNTYFHDNLVPNSVIGFYDGRMVAQRGTPLAAGDDPSTTMYDSSFAATIVSYLSDLHYTTPSTYTMSGNAINLWNFSHAGLRFPDTIPDLAAAMALNPKLKVFSANGYHDLVTPFYNTEGDIARLGGNASLTVRFYQGGHMTYLDDTARTQEKADLAAFYASTVSTKSVIELAPAPAMVVAETPRPTGQIPGTVFETKLRDPSLPEALRGFAPTPPSQGDALRAEVEGRLRTLFESARTKRTGDLTLDEARAAGMGYVVNNFDAIDARHTGSVSFDDVKRFMRAQGAGMLPE